MIHSILLKCHTSSQKCQQISYRKLAKIICLFQVEINEPEWSMLHTSHATIKNFDAEKSSNTVNQPESSQDNYSRRLKALRKLLKKAKKYEAVIRLAIKLGKEKHAHIRLH